MWPHPTLPLQVSFIMPSEYTKETLPKPGAREGVCNQQAAMLALCGEHSAQRSRTCSALHAAWTLPPAPSTLLCPATHQLAPPGNMHPLASAVNPNVDIKEVPARTLVALSWNGNSPREAEVERRTAQLRQLMEQAGLKPKQGGKTHVWQYGERCLGHGDEFSGW